MNLSSTDTECLGCGLTFQKQRKNQQYCSRPCQKAKTHNAARGPRTTTNSPEKRLEKRRQRATLNWMNETFYRTAPGQRLGIIKDWLDRARNGDTKLRAVFCRPDFLEKTDAGVCFLRDKNSPPVPYVAARFCRKFLDCHVWDWVSGRAPEPETGEVQVAAA